LVQLAAALGQLLGTQVAQLAEGANAAGAWLAGAVPHRGPAGRAIAQPGRDVARMLAEPRRAMLLLGIDPALDCADAGGMADALAAADSVIAVSAFEHAALDAGADVLLPAALFGENDGSYVNLCGRWQRFSAAVKPRGEARAAWKILRMLGTKLELDGFEAVDCEDVTREIEALTGAVKPAARAIPTLETSALDFAGEGLEVIVDVPLYAGDALVRHAEALQDMPQAGDDRIRIAAATAAALGLRDGAVVEVSNASRRARATLAIDAAVPAGACALHAARPALCQVAVFGSKVGVRSVG
jgi:NADH-quinone oxidoreductase subunit G